MKRILAAGLAGVAALAAVFLPQSPGASRPTEAKQFGPGALIVFERTVPGAGRALYTIKPTGSKPKLLRSSGVYGRWSPDGRRLSFGACLNPPKCTTALALLNRRTGHVHGFPSPDPDLFMGCGVWAPSGRRVACWGYSDGKPNPWGVRTIRVSDGKGLKRITRNPDGEDVPLAYSPNGRRLLFTRSLGGDHQALFVKPIHGGRAHRITPWGFTDDWADWSPNGRTIVFGSNGFLYHVRPNGHGLAKIHLQVAKPSAGTAFDVSFSPNGKRIVFSLGSPPGIYTAHPNGSHVRRLTNSPTEDHHADWGPAPR